MRSLQRMADGVLGMFVPKVKATALYCWRDVCFEQSCEGNTSFWQNKWCYCHDSGGGCTQCSNKGCCLPG